MVYCSIAPYIQAISLVLLKCEYIQYKFDEKNIGLTKWILIVTKLFWGSVKNRSNTPAVSICIHNYTDKKLNEIHVIYRLKIAQLMFYDCYIYASRWLINWFGKMYFFLHMFYEVLNIIYIADFIILFARWLLKRNYLFIYFFLLHLKSLFFGGRGVL